MRNSFSTSYSLYIVIAFLAFSCATNKRVKNVKGENITITESLVADNATAAEIIAPYKAGLEAEMNAVLNRTEMEMIKQQPEGLLGNFVADLTLIKGNEHYQPGDGQKADFCLLNHGGLRTSLPKGDITRGKVFELMPFENELVVITLTGPKTAELFRYVAAYGGHPIANVKMGIEGNVPSKVMVNKMAFDSTRTYKVITSDYLANGGDKMTFFFNPIKREAIGIKLRDAIINYMMDEQKKGNSLKSSYDGRIYYEH